MQQATGAALFSNNKDIVVLSPTGSGKTLAYMLPVVGLINPKVAPLRFPYNQTS